jgi:hypothetical protein
MDNLLEVLKRRSWREPRLPLVVISLSPKHLTFHHCKTRFALPGSPTHMGSRMLQKEVPCKVCGLNLLRGATHGVAVVDELGTRPCVAAVLQFHQHYIGVVHTVFIARDDDIRVRAIYGTAVATVEDAPLASGIID